MPSKKQKLITDMHKSAKFRGHNMVLVYYKESPRKFWGEWSCMDCGMTAYVNTYPMPNEIDVSGRAMALSCEKTQKDDKKMKIETFKVSEKITLSDNEQMAVENREALFFYHSYIRTEWELIEIAHGMLLYLDENCNYKQTKECRDIEAISKQKEKSIRANDSEPKKYRLNCHFTGKLEWVKAEYMPEIENELIQKLSDYITEVYSIENYGCYYFEGDWGLWPYEIDEY